jgi:hypothetical protein
MMRGPLSTMAPVVIGGSLALAAAVAIAITLSTSAGAHANRAGAASTRRTWRVAMSAAPDDLALAQVSFPSAARGQRISQRSLQVAVGEPFGDDYLAAAALRLSSARVPRMLVLLVNRPSPLADPVSVHVRLLALSALGAASARGLADPLTRAAGAREPDLCDLPLNGSALSASELLALHTRGQALAGFDATEAVAQAYDVSCGLAHSSSFEQAVEQSGSSSTPPVPSPSPPVGKLPGEGCEPRPGYACPETAGGASPPAAVGG